MRIACPYCGERGNEEFIYLGDAALVRPIPAALDADAELRRLRLSARQSARARIASSGITPPAASAGSW